jgi:SOS response regulatory protein OraA/RecX
MSGSQATAIGSRLAGVGRRDDREPDRLTLQRQREAEHRADERRRAVRFLAGRARSADDLRHLLDVLELEASEGRP